MNENSLTNMNNDLEKLNKLMGKKDNANSNIDELSQIIVDLKKKNLLLQQDNDHLKKKVETYSGLRKINMKLMAKLALIGFNKKENLINDVSKLQNDSTKIAEIIKEKDDLHEINEKMLDMLTEKEIKIEELNEKFNKYKLDVEIQNEEYIQQINTLRENIENLENSKNENSVLEQLNEYTEQMEQFTKQIESYKVDKEKLLNE